MRMTGHVATLSLVGLLGACGKPDEPSAPSMDIVVAPQTYQRMRFVSAIEQSRASVPARRPKVARHANPASVSAPDPMAAMMMHTPVAMVTSSVSAPAPSVVIAAHAAPEAVTVPIGPTVEVGGGGIGSMLGGLVGSVVIRGGRVGDGKCDPRTDARANGTIANRPDFSMPQPTGQPTFGRRR